MTEQLRVLVVESESHAADAAIEDLRRAGHEIVRCTEPGAPSFPCAGVRGTCPLESPGVDVVLDVRRRPRSQPAPGEVGVTCALRRHVPLVVAGSLVLEPYEEWAVAEVEQTERIVETVERAAVDALRAHSEVATRALRSAMAVRGLDVDAATVRVYRRKGRLVAAIQATPPLPSDLAAMASVRIVAAVRAFDAYAGGIDVVVETPSHEAML
jgi:hypothetical protein